MEFDIFNEFDITIDTLNKHLSKLKKKQEEYQTTLIVQNDNVNDAEKKTQNLIEKKINTPEEYIKLSMFAKETLQEIEKENKITKNIEDNKLDVLKIENSISKLINQKEKYGKEYERLTQLKNNHQNALNNEQITSQMKQMQENKLKICEIKMNCIELEMANSLDRVINKLPDKLQKEIGEQLPKKEQDLEDNINEEPNNDLDVEVITPNDEQNNHQNDESNEEIKVDYDVVDENIDENVNNKVDTNENNEEQVLEKAMVIPEKGRQLATNIHNASDKIKEKIASNKGKIALALVGSIAAVAIILANPMLAAAIPAAYVVSEFNKGKKL